MEKVYRFGSASCSNIETKSQIQFRCGLPAQAPVFEGGLDQNDQDVGGLDTQPPQSRNDALVQLALGFKGATGKEQEFHKGVVFCLARRDGAVLELVLNVADLLVIFRHLERVDLGLVNSLDKAATLSGECERQTSIFAMGMNPLQLEQVILMSRRCGLKHT
ncbi:MAG: hypothetical protein PHO64_08845, partial [Thiomonas sp.]|nr:hypothetical protein [Thiomonas sp.]